MSPSSLSRRPARRTIPALTRSVRDGACVCFPEAPAVAIRPIDPKDSALELDLQLLDLFRFRLSGADPFLHRRQSPDLIGVSLADAVERDVIGPKTADDGGVHGVGDRNLAEKVRTAIGFEALAPDRLDAFDVRDGFGPDLELGEMPFDIHRQGLAHRNE